MQSKATTVDEYLADLPADRREAIATIRDVVRKNLDADYEEGMQYGMIGYYVPHRVLAGRVSLRSEAAAAVRRSGVAEESFGGLSHVRVRKSRSRIVVPHGVGEDRQKA
jgi:hypothetical protein